MAHPEQMEFCNYVKNLYPNKFRNCSVLDIGSLDINGNNRYLFENYTYIGVDLDKGKNVDIVSKGHLFKSDKKFDIVISTECFEHDQHWKETILNCYNLTKQDGIFLFTCATDGRQEHGTTKTTPQDSPFTHTLFNDYYMNLNEGHIRSVLNVEDLFSIFEFSKNDKTKDLYFYGIKK